MSKKDYFLHVSSFVDKGAIIGKGTAIWHFCHILKGAVVGERCKIGQNVVIHGTSILGNNVKIQNNVSIYDGVILEDDVFCGPSCVFTNIKIPRATITRNSTDHFMKTVVHRGVTIGANATIICGIDVGQYAFIGAGAVVTKNVKPYALLIGVPATQQGWVCECGERLKIVVKKAVCKACGIKYSFLKNVLCKSKV